MVGGDGVMVGSQMADCVHDDGSWQGRVRMEAVPGLRAPSVAEINEARSPRGFGTPVAQSGEGVWRDEVREV